MGKTKTKIMDDSQPEAEEVKSASAKASSDKPERKKILGTNVKRDKELEKSSVHQPTVGAGLPSSEKETDEELKTKEDKAVSVKAQKKITPEQGRKVRSKKYQEAQELVDKGRNYPIDEAAELVKTISYTKFDGTLEIHINTAVKGVRGLINLPFASGKKLKILAFGKDAQDSGADIVGDDAQLAEIMKGKVNFDVLVTTPDWMPKLARAAKTLGPKGLMPNPKNGTITTDLKKTISELQGGKTEYKTEAKANVIHLGIGKVSQPKEELSQNIRLLLSTIGKTKIKKAVISPTMGPSIKLDLSSL